MVGVTSSSLKVGAYAATMYFILSSITSFERIFCIVMGFPSDLQKRMGDMLADIYFEII
jgi:hypothetical protein